MTRRMPRHGGRSTRRILACAAALLCATAASAEPRTVVYVVRHAEKAEEPRRDPGLTPEGRQRTEALRAALADARLTGVVTSNFTRTRATARPVVEATGLEPVIVPYRVPHFEAHGAEVAAAILERFAGGSVLVVGHSDTIPAIVKSLGGPEIARLCEPTEYASLFTLVVDGAAPTSLVRSEYGKPNPPTPPECLGER